MERKSTTRSTTPLGVALPSAAEARGFQKVRPGTRAVQQGKRLQNRRVVGLEREAAEGTPRKAATGVGAIRSFVAVVHVPAAEAQKVEVEAKSSVDAWSVAMCKMRFEEERMAMLI